MKEPKQILVTKDMTIKLYDETNFGLESVDNLNKYNKTYTNGDESILTSKIGIEIFKNDKLLSSCLIASEGGGTGIFKDSTFINSDSLLVCCANSIFKLTIPDLNIEWKKKSDSATCFSIHYLDKDNYLVHGELEITRLNNDGDIIWQKGGRDIWVTAEGIDDFTINDDYILATDWEYNRYKLDFNGNLIEGYKVEPKIEKSTKNTLNLRKWWEIWK